MRSDINKVNNVIPFLKKLKKKMLKIREKLTPKQRKRGDIAYYRVTNTIAFLQLHTKNHVWKDDEFVLKK
tara:strand:+ start:775 stop:984 length:210 start_codon:yes stop_codon:yes gene_type:complete